MNNRSHAIHRAWLRWNLAPIVGSVKDPEGHFGRRIIFIKPYELKAAMKQYGHDLHIGAYDEWFKFLMREFDNDG